MRKTTFLVTERRTLSSDREARETLQRCVTLWLKTELRKQTEKPAAQA